MSKNIVPVFPYFPDEYLYEIGKVVVASNRLESLMLHTLIVAVAGGFASDGKALAALAPMGFGQRANALESLLKLIDEDIAKVYCERVRNLLEKAQGERNSAVHQEWIADDDGTVKRLSIQAKGTLKISVKPISIQEVMDSSQLIAEAHAELLALITIPLADKLRPQDGQ